MGLMNSWLVSATLCSSGYTLSLSVYISMSISTCIYIYRAIPIDNCFTILTFKTTYVPQQVTKLILLWSQCCLTQGQENMPRLSNV